VWHLRDVGVLAGAGRDAVCGMNRYAGNVTRGNTRLNTFLLLWCEGCGKAEEPPLLPGLTIVGETRLPCAKCGGELTLVECFVRGTHVHDALGAPHRYVATLEDLTGRP
jgi:hypothetical protein